MCWWRFALAAILFAPLAILAEDPDVQPFHTLHWDDGIVEVITKLNQIPGLTKLVWCRHSYQYRENGWEQRSVYYNKTANDDLTKGLPSTFIGQISMVAASLYNFDASFIDSSGKKWGAPGEGVNQDTTNRRPIIGESVNLFGIPFEVSVCFYVSYGFGIEHPEKALQFVEGSNKTPTILPLMLRSVSLSSESMNIPENLDKLIEAAKAKYPSGVIKDSEQPKGREGSFTFSDAHGHKFGVYWEGVPKKPEVDISYSSMPAEKFAEIYRKHLGAKAGAKSPDLKSGL